MGMDILLTIYSLIAALIVLINPVWGTCAYVGMLFIRPNEMVDGIPIPSIPIMIMLMAISYLHHRPRSLSTPPGPKIKSVKIFLIMTALCFVHLLLFRRWAITQYILDETAPTFLILVYYLQHLSTIERLHTATMSLTYSMGFVVSRPLYIHFFEKQAPRMVKNVFGEKVISYGKLYDEYHLEQRLQGRYNTTWGNANDFGMITNMAVPGALYLLLQTGSKLKKIIGALLLSMFGCVIILTGSRGSQLQFAVNLWMILVGGKRKILGVILLLIAVVGVLIVLPRFAPQREDSAASANSRTALLYTAWDLFKYRPITGIGFYCFEDYSKGKQPPHNVYAQALAETGIIGGAIFFSLVFFLRRETNVAVKYYETEGTLSQALLARCIGGLQFSFFIFILFSNQFMRFTFTLVNAACLALILAMRRDIAAKKAS